MTGIETFRAFAQPIGSAHHETEAGTLAPIASAASRRFPAALIGGAILVLVVFGLGAHLDLALLALGILVVGLLLLWRPGESPVLAITFAIQWIGASVAIFYAHWLGIDLARYSQFNGDLIQATQLTLIGLLFVAVGMRLGLGSPRPADVEEARRIALAYGIERWAALYGVATMVSFLVLASVWVVPGLYQVMLAAAGLHWAFFFVLAYATFIRGVPSPYLPLAFCFEFALSLGNFFSDFQTVFLVTISAALAAGRRLTTRTQLGLVVLVVGLVGVTLVWTGVKEEYRRFVSDGQQAQAVSVDYVTRIGKLAELTSELDARRIEAGVDTMLRRISYVEFFSVVLGHVPASIPHENGVLLSDALSRPFFPRALFPGKSIINDTERTNYYTGGLAGQSDATSISIGYVGEAYIDFGAYGMMASLFGIGIAYGAIYRLLSRAKAAGGLVGMGLATAVLQGIGHLDSSFTKVAGGLAVSLLVALLLVRFVLPLWLRWASEPGGMR